MKKILSCLICVLLLLTCVTGCRDEDELYSEWISYYESLPESGSDTNNDIAIESVTESADESDATTPQNTIKYESTIKAPYYMTLYKGGMQAIVKDTELRQKAAKEIENLFYDYTNDNLPTQDMEVTPQFIWELRQNETVIELQFSLEYKEKLTLLGKINLEKTYAVLMPITGKYAYYLFSGYDVDRYTNKPYKLKGSGVEKIFEGVTLDKKVRSWESTVSAPATVTFYKDGASTVSTDKELNHKIARHIENWFKYKQLGIGLLLGANTDTLRPIKYNEMAVELQFDNEIVFFGQTKFKNSRTIFIPVTGEHKNIIFNNSINSPNNWSGPIYGGTGLEQYFQYVQFTPLTEEEKRWRSTVSVPTYISAVEAGQTVGEAGITFMADYSISYDLMVNVEKLFYHKEEIKRSDNPISDTAFQELKSKGKYLLISVSSERHAIYGQEVFSKDTDYILIPLDGEYAYYILELDQNRNQCANPIITDGGNLEKDFQIVKSKGLHADRYDNKPLDEIDNSPIEDY